MAGINSLKKAIRERKVVELLSATADETMRLGQWLRSFCLPGDIVCFKGDLAAGKTTFIKGFVKEAGLVKEDEVGSPTFVYLNIYYGSIPIYHFDLYRLSSSKEFIALGFDEFLSSQGICCIEWSERIEGIIPSEVIDVQIFYQTETSRKIIIDYWV